MRFDYEALLAGLPDAVVGVDEGLRIVLWNPAAEALLGRSARRVVGRTLKEVFPAETSLARHLSDTLTTGESRSEAEALVETPDGRSMHVSIVTAPLAGKSGAVTAAVAVVRDITRLYQLEAEMRRGETLAAATEKGAKKWLPANNEPPTAIVSRLYLAALSRPPTSDEQAAAIEMLGQQPTSETVQDLLWAVLMLPEFQLVR